MNALNMPRITDTLNDIWIHPQLANEIVLGSNEAVSTGSTASAKDSATFVNDSNA